ncbi:hypothetical protein [Methylomonas lenta]|uniref:hypothetical protein n=1 Tax=Methylomonas lenta TaxID=980561 RepID=UPI000A5FD337|nr:hypothetical protein [Methylomonas lenta]
MSGQQHYPVCPPSIDGLFAHYHSAAFDVHENQTVLESLDNERVSVIYHERQLD